MLPDWHINAKVENMKKRTLRIGNVELENPFLLAPLAGITDAPFRRLCHRFGAALVYSEMVSAKGLWYGDKKTDQLLSIHEEEKPVAYQIFGSDPEIMAFAAKELNDRENVILDVNMGCPVPKIVKNGEGSALLKDPDLIYDIISQMVKATDKPVTAKIRLGFEKDSFLAIEAAKAIEAAGGSAVAVHGRTREQYYSGEADWDKIAKVRENISIPLIGNGDVTDYETAKKIMEVTGCDLVMIGRGALGSPWIFRELKAGWNGEEIPMPPDIEEKKKLMLEHFDMVLAQKGEYAAVREMRKFIGWYMKGVKGGAALRGKVNTITDSEELRSVIRNFGM